MKNDMTRLYSFDALKVLSIYMVIVGHVLFYSFHEANNLVWQFIDVVNMQCLCLLVVSFQAYLLLKEY